MIPLEWRNWAESAKTWWIDQGANPEAAFYFALLWGYASVLGLKPRITSIFRDPKYQRELQERWDAGDRAGLRARPASNSKHSKETWLGKPNATAMDMPSRDDKVTAQIAKALGLGAGSDFTKPDPGHYFFTAGDV